MTGRVGIALVGLIPLGMIGFGVFLMTILVADQRIALTWSRETATIQAIGEPRSTRRGAVFMAVLQVQQADGSVLVNWSERALQMPARDYPFGPRPAPRIGDRVDVRVAPRSPPRIIPAESLAGFGYAASVLLVFGVMPVFVLRGLADSWRIAGEAARSQAEAAGDTKRRPSPHQRKGGRRWRRR